MRKSAHGYKLISITKLTIFSIKVRAKDPNSEGLWGNLRAVSRDPETIRKHVSTYRGGKKIATYVEWWGEWEEHDWPFVSFYRQAAGLIDLYVSINYEELSF